MSYTAVQRKEILQQYLDNPTDQNRNKLMLANQALVIYVCNKHFKAWKNSCWEDVLQEGMIGLSRAIPMYKPGLSEFSSYASLWIRGHLNTFLRREALQESGEFAKKHERMKSNARIFDKMISLNHHLGIYDAHGVSHSTFQDRIPSDYNVLDEVILKESNEMIKNSIKNSALNSQQGSVIEDYYYNDISLVDIAKKKNLSKQRIGQIKANAIKKLQQYL